MSAQISLDDFIIPNSTKQVFLPYYGWIGPFNSAPDANQHVLDWIKTLSDEEWFDRCLTY